jgi:hypothetical protein
MRRKQASFLVQERELQETRDAEARAADAAATEAEDVRLSLLVTPTKRRLQDRDATRSPDAQGSLMRRSPRSPSAPSGATSSPFRHLRGPSRLMSPQPEIFCQICQSNADHLEVPYLMITRTYTHAHTHRQAHQQIGAGVTRMQAHILQGPLHSSMCPSLWLPTRFSHVH